MSDRVRTVWQRINMIAVTHPHVNLWRQTVEQRRRLNRYARRTIFTRRTFRDGTTKGARQQLHPIANAEHRLCTSIIGQRGRVGVVDKNGQVAFLLTASADAVSSIDPQQVRDRITGVSVPDALARLQRDYLLDPRHPPQIDLLLPFLNRLPVLPIRIDVTVVQ